MSDLHQSAASESPAAPNTGYLFINLGTPDSPAIPDVRRYLREFLMDKYVLAVPWPIRKLIVSGFILPFRPKNSAEAYAKIWTAEGSPLLTISQELSDGCAEELEAPVVLAMRYGSPSIQQAISSLVAQGISEINIVPLYPHYADSTVTTTLERVEELLPGHVSARVFKPFFANPGYISALADTIRSSITQPHDHLLLSYHSLPEFHLTKADPTGQHCLQAETCCNPEPASEAHRTCYRHHVMMTSWALAKELNLQPDQYSISFQSRLGRVPWLKPYTDEVLADLPGRGIKHLAVACPAFVVDNLETLEEIGLQGRDTFLSAGGETFQLAPCLNQRPDWIRTFSNMLTHEVDYTELARP